MQTKLPGILTKSMEFYPEPFVIRDIENNYIFTNQAAVRMFRVRSEKDLIGKKDQEISSKLTEKEEVIEDWTKLCLKVTSKKNKVSSLEIHPEAVNLPYVATTLPMLNDSGDCIGAFVYMKSLDVYTLSDFIKGKAPGSLMLNKPGDYFNEKECEVIFLKSQGLSNKEVAKLLFLSPRTIENKLHSLYEKVGVNHIDDLLHFCNKDKYDRYIPKRFITQRRMAHNGFVDNSCEWEW